MPRRRFRLLQSLVVMATAVVVIVPMLVAGNPTRVQARRKYHYPHHSYAAYIAKCKRGCAATAGVLKRCIVAKDLKAGLLECRGLLKQQLADCSGDGSCKRGAKKAYLSCKKQKVQVTKGDLGQISGRYGAKRCGSCCVRTRGQSNCQTYLSNSRWYGSYRRYGKLFCQRNDIPNPPPGSPSGAFSGDYSDRIRARLGALIPFLTRGWSH